MAGEIQTPAIRWRYRLGGEVDQTQAVLCQANAARPNILLIALPGRLTAYTLDGGLLWERSTIGSLILYGCWDFAADGNTQLLASSSNSSGAQLYLFDTTAGDLLWMSAPGGGGVGAIKVLNLDATPALELLWLPAASSGLRTYTFTSGVRQPALLWESEIPDFVSDPYSFSSIAVTNPGPEGREIVISGGRNQIQMIILHASNGAEVARRTYDAHGSESGGPRQLLALQKVDGTGGQRVIAIADYPSSATYMFQGLTATNPKELDDMVMLDTFPVGLHYVNGSIADFDPDGSDDILVSRYVPEEDRHDLLLLSAADLRVKATLRDFYLLAIISLEDRLSPLVLGLQGVITETPTGTEQAVAYRHLAVGFAQTAWRPGAVTLARLLSRSVDQIAIDNPGASAVVLKTNDGPPSILLSRGSAAGGKTELIASDLSTGTVVAEYSPAELLDLTLLAVQKGTTAATSRIVVGQNDGSLVFLDGAFRAVARVPVAGYYRSHATNGHSSEVAVVADLTGSDCNDVVVVDSQNRIVKLLRPADPLQAPQGAVLWSSGKSQELITVPGLGQGFRFLARGKRNGNNTLNLLDGTGSSVWEHIFDPGEGIPNGLNFGRLQRGTVPDIVAACGREATYPRETCALDGRTGALLWRSSIGTYWDATLAVSDLNGDSSDDVVLNFNSSKGYVLDGRSGELLTTPITLPPYQDLYEVDYNGAPVIVGSDGNGTRVLNAEDDAHVALLTVACDPPGDASALSSTTSWLVSQNRVDDQRYSMPAVAPDGQGGWMIGVGSQRGSFEVRSGRDGSLLWGVFLSGGQIVPGNPTQPNSLSSVVAVDVDGDGRTDFVVGGADGWLYALQPETHRLLWSIDLGSPVGDPIAADLDNDRRSEILVAAADGYLYAIGPAPR